MNSVWETVTHRERQVLKLVAEGHPNRYIAEFLCLSVKTVEKHRSNMMKKLDLHNASALTTFAIEKGLVSTGLSATVDP
jgi:DNA-binding NarL/FixJ family response regulator